MQLYAELQPEALLPFLTASQSYSLEPALTVCERYGLVPEQVTITSVDEAILTSTASSMYVNAHDIGMYTEEEVQIAQCSGPTAQFTQRLSTPTYEHMISHCSAAGTCPVASPRQQLLRGPVA